MIVRAAHPDHYGWIASRAGLNVGPQFRAIEAVDDSGRIHGMVGYDGWTQPGPGGMVSIHIALDNPAALRCLLDRCFKIPFEDFDKRVVVATVLSSNVRSMRLVRHVGFIETHRIVDGWADGVDLVLFEMRRGNCRWLSRQNGTRMEAA